MPYFFLIKSIITMYQHMPHLDYYRPFHFGMGVCEFLSQHIGSLSYYLNVLYNGVIEYWVVLKLLISNTIKECGNTVNSILDVLNTTNISQRFSHGRE